MPLDTERIKAICFDVDGTLSDTDDEVVHRLYTMLRPLYRSKLLSQYAVQGLSRWMVMAMETPGNLAYTAVDRTRMDDAVLHPLQKRMGKQNKVAPSFWLIEGVVELLTGLAARYPLAVVTARDEAGTLAFLEQFSLQGQFGAVATARTCQYTKPFPDPVVWAAGELGVAPEDCLMVGDTTVDMRAGKAAGAQTVGVLCGFGREKELLRAGADLILPHTADLMDVLLDLPSQPICK
jgi:HAD superfamily hydrolase (TIGR01549 family)